MTVCVGVVVNDGMVFAADSASSVVQTDQHGHSTIVNVYQHGDKVYNLHRRLPVVAMTCGMGNVGTASIATLAKELRQRLMSDDAAWRVDPLSYTIEDIAKKARKLIFEEKFQALSPIPAAPHSLEFWIGGYPANPSSGPEVWQIVISNGACGDPTVQVKGGSGLFWGGQPSPIHRLIKGYDADVVPLLVNNGVDAATAQGIGALFQSNLEVPLVNATMPIRDAIDLADFLAETTKRYFRFLPGADVVGGDTDIAVVTRFEGFKWIRRKHFYNSALNPREPDHA